MAELTDKLTYKTQREIRYTRGMQCMYRERYFVYLEDLRRAREARDYNRAAEISRDMQDYAKEVRHLMTRQRIAFERLALLKRGGPGMDTQPFPAITATAVHEE